MGATRGTVTHQEAAGGQAEDTLPHHAWGRTWAQTLPVGLTMRAMRGPWHARNERALQLYVLDSDVAMGMGSVQRRSATTQGHLLTGLSVHAPTPYMMARPPFTPQLHHT